MQNQPTTQPPLFSILMPVYNAAATLEAAARSVLDQSQGDLELLLVDDGSADGSLELARSLAAADPRVRVFAQKNGGICAARNRALAEARGRYLGFCDDDDLYLPGALAAVTALIARTGADLIRTGYELRRQTADSRFVTLPHPAGTPCRLDPAPDGGAYLHFLRQSGPQFVWNAWYRREFFGALRFDGRCRAGLEDFVLNAAVYARGPRAVYDPVVTTRQHLPSQRGGRGRPGRVAAPLGRSRTRRHGRPVRSRGPAAGLGGAAGRARHLPDAPAAGQRRPPPGGPGGLAGAAQGAGPAGQPGPGP